VPPRRSVWRAINAGPVVRAYRGWDLREELVANDRQVLTILAPAVPVQEFNAATSSHDVKREGTGYVVGQYYP